MVPTSGALRALPPPGLVCFGAVGSGQTYNTVDACEVHFAPVETMANHCWLVFTRESLQGFLGGAGFRSSTV